MAGIYLHIPFCKQACNYCNFHFSVNKNNMPQMVQAIANEIHIQQAFLSNSTIHTIYFGGGTPSLLSLEQINLLLNTIQQHFSIATEAEITLEVNPDDCTLEKLQAWRNAGINRLSIGTQSFRVEDLKWMNRSHNALSAIRAIEQAHQASFHNISIDLIYGIPGLTTAAWLQNVQQATQLPIQHLSCYALTVEPKTALSKAIQKKLLPDINTDEQALQFELLMQWLPDAGFQQYEVSNFAKPGFESKHNSSYWKGIPYLGLGPSAHSYNGQWRQWNIANNTLYIQSIEKGIIPSEIEELTPSQKRNEQIMIALRMKEGIYFNRLSNLFSAEHKAALLRNADRWINQNFMEWFPEVQQLRLTNKGMLYADGIAADLFEAS
jgi:oxygen-independent coproporphyrinogen-3 oxidase